MYISTLKGAKSMPEMNVKLTLRFEREDGETMERVIEGSSAIAYILDAAGLLDEKIIKFLTN